MLLDGKVWDIILSDSLQCKPSHPYLLHNFVSLLYMLPSIIASQTQWTWVYVNSRSWWWIGRPGVLQFMGLQRIRHDWVTDLKYNRLCMRAKSLQSCLTLGDHMDCSTPGFSVHGILQARIMEWVAMSSSRGSSNPGIKPRSPALQADSLPSWATREA